MVEGILEQVRAFVAKIASGALAPFQGVIDFFSSPLPFALLIVAAIIVACSVVGWFFGAQVRWFLGWVVTAAGAFAAGAVWLWLAMRKAAPKVKPKPKPAPPPPTQGQWPWT